MQEKRTPPFGLRMPDELKRKVKEAAAREERSMNAQIVSHLRDIYQPEPQESP